MMTTKGYVVVPAGYTGEVAVVSGPRLLAGIEGGPTLENHRRTWGPPPAVDARELVERTSLVSLRGRGGAGFPFSRKLQTTIEAGRKRAVVVNASEGEPGSAKDSALLLTAPHLVLDGAEVIAQALDADAVQVITPSERPAVAEAVARAIQERGGQWEYRLHSTGGMFVGGQSRAVIEAIEGRENLPVTAWQPEAVEGVKGRPTLLSNAETFAHVAAITAMGVHEYLRAGTADEPGTTLLTVAGDGPGAVVVEVPFGTALAEILLRCGYEPDGVVLMGGYHGVWMPPEQVLQRRVSRADLALASASLGAGVVLPLDPATCPVEVTSRIVQYLAAHSARRCGPCRNGLPALADALTALADHGSPAATARANQLLPLVNRRGACAHPDGTVRLVASMFAAFPDEVALHEAGHCGLRMELVSR